MSAADDLRWYRSARAGEISGVYAILYEADKRIERVDKVLQVLRDEVARCRWSIRTGKGVDAPFDDLVEAGKFLANHRGQLEKKRAELASRRATI